ncbi:uncharacterized protein VICG_01903 [Vittaforma corneae ATCC 50505]|uniref:polynucleotide adenylyltransferase n=1 Tax=Vittaforma corneae (strain ATCC 50505) TaxID=993615 RepID=L2GJI3_VITCO|nr:uncharacterized protein VICG_01903 [Vittaforma corneae ATCC 50505]ELA41021.1 hypothetical protein VICG_01903 [Vittaforma corneae ATCC 50505]
MRGSNAKSTTEKSKSNSVGREKNKRAYRSILINHMLKFRGERAPTLNQKLNEELLLSYNKIKLTDTEIKTRNKVFELFKKVIEDALDCQVESHGSFRTGTMVYGSDIDITVLMNKETIKKPRSLSYDASYKPYSNQILAKIANIIESNNIITGNIIHIKNARVPVLKCVDKIFNCKVDIVIDKYDSIKSANFVIKQLEERPYLKYLATLLKYFLKRRHLSEAIRGGLCSYAQFLLILNFVQLHPLIQNGNIRVEDNLGTIFMDFFQLYGLEFPFERTIISVLETRYKPNRDSQINIEDPCNQGHNVAAGCTALPMIREIFSFSYKIMAAAFAEKVATNKAIGELWLRIDEQELASRNKLNKVKNENKP